MRYRVRRQLEFVRSGTGSSKEIVVVRAGDEVDAVALASLAGFDRAGFDRMSARHKASGEPGGPLVIFEFEGAFRSATIGRDLEPLDTIVARHSLPARPDPRPAPLAPRAEPETTPTPPSPPSRKPRRWSERLRNEQESKS